MAIMLCEFDGAVPALGVYVQPLGDVGRGDWEFLIPREQAKAERFRLPNKRHEYVQARSLLRALLGCYLQCAPTEVPIEYADYGKPYLPEGLGLYFNVSHTDGLAVLTFSKQRVGVDVERLRPMPDARDLVARFLSRHESLLFQDVPDNELVATFFRAWTRKEAILKAIGRGVQVLDCCDVTFAPDEPPRVLRLFDDTNASAQWEMFAWEPAAGYVAALAVEQDRVSIHAD
jgi:4'-phosphopantetheinyl transferase